jgi:hypothetical protein
MSASIIPQNMTNAKQGGIKTCQICEEFYNKSNRTPICCLYCNFDACMSCCETFVTNETVPKCMNTQCGKEWSRKFMRESFTSSFITKQYKKHIEEILFDKERALLPATQPIVEMELQREAIKKQVDQIDELIRALRKEKEQIILNGRINEESAETTKAHFIRGCPSPNCRGFLNNHWNCGMCKCNVCKDCHEIKSSGSTEHQCNPDNVETAKLLDKDTKPCPVCHTNIFKISGCDQMWCTQCRTAFSWKKGTIEHNVHNPHYFEWQQQTGGVARTQGDIECGRDLENRIIASITQLINKKHKSLVTTIKGSSSVSGTRYIYHDQINRLSNIIRCAIHLQQIEMPRFQMDPVVVNQRLRVSYLKKALTEAHFKTEIQRADKKYRKNLEIRQVMQLIHQVVTDIVYRFMDHLKNCQPDAYNFEMFTEFDSIIKHCNDIFADISFTYSCVQYQFDSQLKFTSIKKEEKAGDSQKSQVL